MNRTDTYEKGKISKVTDDNVAMNIYLDAFSIEKVRFQNVNYEDRTSIDCYVDFEEIVGLAADITSGNLRDSFGAGKIVSMGGSKSSKRFDGKPESRIMEIRVGNNNILINMRAGEGKLNEHELIFPVGKSDKNITVIMPVEKFRNVILYTYDCMRAYLPTLVNKLVDELEASRASYIASIKGSKES